MVRASSRYLIESIVIALVYVWLGSLTRGLTLPPAGISPVWLPAGFALGVVLVRGWWTAIPLFVAAAGNTIRVDWPEAGAAVDSASGFSHPDVLWSAVVFGVAVISHALIARWLIGRYIADREYSTIKSALLFVLFAGPISCLASTTFGIYSYWIEGLVSVGSLASSAYLFWVGDSVACIAIAPIFVAIGCARQWRSRQFAVVGASLAVLTLVAATAELVGTAEERRLERGFAQDSHVGSSRVMDSLSGASEGLTGLATLASINAPLAPADFRRAAAVLFKRLDSLGDVRLLSAGTDSDGEVHNVVLDDIATRELDAEGDDSAARGSSSRRASMAEIRRNSSERPSHRDALTSARDEGRVAAVRGSAGERRGTIVFYAPIYRDGAPTATPRQRREAIAGFVGGAVDSGVALSGSLAALSRGSSVVLVDATSGDEPIRIAARPAADNLLVHDGATPEEAADDAGLPFTSTDAQAAGGRTFATTFAPDANFVPDRAFWSAIFPATMLALLLAMTIEVLVLSQSGRRVQLSRLVAKRTRALARNEEKYRSVLSNVREAIFQVDDRNRVVFANDALRNFSSTADGQPLEGFDIVRVVNAADDAEVRDLLVQARAEPGVVHRAEVEVADGRIAELRVVLPLNDEGDGEIVGLVSDVTEQRASLRSREQFLEIVSHELRNPLTVISGSMDTIIARELNDLPEITRQLVPGVRSSAERMARIIDDLLLASQAESGNLRLLVREVGARELVHESVVRAAANAAAAKIDLRESEEQDGRDGEAMLVTADPERVAQVLDNLISNAIKYTPSGGWVRVGVSRSIEGKRVVLRFAVSDNGIGIAKEDQRRIFERFNRTELGVRMARGSGLGLLICKVIAEEHGGEIEVDSTPGEGSVFTLVLPVKGPEINA